MVHLMGVISSHNPAELAETESDGTSDMGLSFHLSDFCMPTGHSEPPGADTACRLTLHIRMQYVC